MNTQGTDPDENDALRGRPVHKHCLKKPKAEHRIGKSDSAASPDPANARMKTSSSVSRMPQPFAPDVLFGLPSEGGQLVTQHEASSFTLHSLKCALLSAAAQLRLPEDSRRLQGHRRLSSALLYSRDDTIEALWVSELTSAIRRGWRPP